MTKRKGYAAVNEAFDAAKKGNTLLRKMIKESADMADTEARCEPPPELRERDGWHWVQFDPWPPRFAEWHASPYGGRQPLWRDYERQRSCTPEWAAKEWGWRYIAPVATPAEVDALRAEADEWKRLCTIAEPGVAALRAELQRCEAACFDVQRDNIALRARVAELDADADALRGRVVRLWELVRSAYAEGWQDSRTDDQYDTATDAWDRSAACAALEGNPHE